LSVSAIGRGIIVLAIALPSAGCFAPVIDTTPGRSRGTSINGTGAFAELLRQRGHQVRTARRATERLAEWANVIVRFSLHPGLPEKDEAKWFQEWLAASPGRKLVYVVQDFDTEPEFWDAVIAAEPKDANPLRLERLKKNRDSKKLWASDLPPKPKETPKEADWFSMEPKPKPPSPCSTLDGLWAEGVDAKAAAVSKHEVFKVEADEPVLLIGDGSPLAISWSFENGSQVLALANASFLLNAALLNKARRPLTMRVADWIGGPPLHVAFVEGTRPMLAEEDEKAASPFHLFQVPPFNWVVPQMLGFLLLLALSYAVRPGRPLPEAPSGVERPSAHPEALGALLAKTGRADSARFLLETYRRWRHHSLASGRKAPAPPPLG
jgi:hypothetical protein